MPLCMFIAPDAPRPGASPAYTLRGTRLKLLGSAACMMMRESWLLTIPWHTHMQCKGWQPVHHLPHVRSAAPPAHCGSRGAAPGLGSSMPAGMQQRPKRHLVAVASPSFMQLGDTRAKGRQHHACTQMNRAPRGSRPAAHTSRWSDLQTGRDVWPPRAGRRARGR